MPPTGSAQDLQALRGLVALRDELAATGDLVSSEGLSLPQRLPVGPGSPTAGHPYSPSPRSPSPWQRRYQPVAGCGWTTAAWPGRSTRTAWWCTVAAGTHRTEVWLDTDLETARLHLPATAGDLRIDPAGGVVLASGAEDLVSMARMLSGLPWGFAVTEQAELVQAIHKHYEALGVSVARSLGV